MLGNSKMSQPKRLGFQLLRKFAHQGDNQQDPQVRTEGSKDDSAVLSVYLASQKKAVAQVVLNGYNIERNEAPGSPGAMRSFRIIQGDLWDQWNEQTAVILRDADGQDVAVRIAALPVDSASFGLLEFISERDLSND